MNLAKLPGLARSLLTHRRAVRQFLQFSDRDEQTIGGSVNGPELEYLAKLVRRANDLPGPVVEIGTLFGFTTQRMALSKHPDKALITVDNFRWNPLGLSPGAHRDLTRQVLHYVCERANTTIFEGSNVDYYRNYDGSPPALVFIDAGHSYDDVMVDIRWAVEHDVAIICGHDYAPGMPGVVKAVDEVFGDQVEVVGSVWAHIKADHPVASAP